MKKLIKNVFFCALFWIFPVLVMAGDDLLEMKTQTRVSSEGKVFVDLTIKNTSDKTLYQIAPMFHFHHTMSHMSIIKRLRSGDSRKLTNAEHPRVLRSGRYPLVVMAKYKISLEADSSRIQTHMSSFDYREVLRSAIITHMESEPGSESILLKIILENQSDSFKNLRLMLLLPIGLKADIFGKGVLGFTIRGRDKKKIEIPITRGKKIPGGQFKIYLMTEYGEMEKHYSNEVSGTILFESSWREVSFKTHVLFVAVFVVTIMWFYFSRKRIFSQRSI